MKDAITGLMFFYIVCFQIFFFSLKKKKKFKFYNYFLHWRDKSWFLWQYFFTIKSNERKKFQIGITYFPKLKKNYIWLTDAFFPSFQEVHLMIIYIYKVLAIQHSTTIDIFVKNQPIWPPPNIKTWIENYWHPWGSGRK